MSVWHQREITLEARPRGFHLVTGEIEQALPELREVRVGLAHLFIRHTSASLTINENASPDVRRDFESFFDAAVPEDAPYWTHTSEGPDDMPAHVKASLLGPALSLPVREGRLALGTWQGVYLCEHRDRGGPRKLLVTVLGTG
jgi:secondary thiamine-phosphate synthase enzyme